MKVKQREREEAAARSEKFSPDGYEYEDTANNPPELEKFYGPLRNYVKTVTGGYHKPVLSLNVRPQSLHRYRWNNR